MNRKVSVLLVLVMVVILVGSALNAQPVVPVEEWKAPFNYALDAAWAVDASDGTVAVVGNRGLVIYDGNGGERARVEMDVPQRGVLIVGERVFTGGDNGISAYSLDGDLLWSAALASGCQRLALLGKDTLLALSGGKIVSFSSLSGRRLRTVERGVTVLATSGTTLVVAKGNRISCLKSEKIAWTRDVGLTAADLALDSDGDVWAIGGESVLLISGRTGSVMWKREFPGTPTAISVLRGGEIPLIGSRDSGVVTGYIESDKGKDYITIVFSRDGEILWRAVYDSGHGDDIAYDVTTTDRGEIIVTGSATNVASDTSKDDYLTIAYSFRQSTVGSIASVESRQQPPIADFSYSPDSPYTYSQISFDNRSHDPDGIIVAYAWYFGDAGQARTENANHAYLHPGDYDVTLTVVDNDGLSDSCTKTVHVANRPPEAGWTMEVKPGNKGLTADFDWSVYQEQHGTYPQGFEPEGATDLDDILFEDLSTVQGGVDDIHFVDASDDWDGEIITWNWEFGDGETSEEQNPTHHYEEPGTYHVVLTVTDNDGATDVYEGDVDVEESGSEIVSWEWDFGDEGSSDEQNPTHWFQDDGTYPVTLTVQDADGNSDSITKEIDVINVPPDASFTWESEPTAGELSADFDWSVYQEQHGTYPQGFEPEGATDLDDILFEDLSTVQGGVDDIHFVDASDDWDGEIITWNWEFGDGETSEEQNPTHHYEEPGTYHVVLTVTDNDGATDVYEGDVDVEESGSEIVSWEWDFGDEGSSDEQNPTHWFQDDGTYPVTLTVQDADGNSDSVTKEVAIENVPPVVAFSWSFEQPDDLLPPCEYLLPEGEEDGLRAAAATIADNNGGVVCQNPEVPDDAGVVAFNDLSHDGESWHEIAARQWEWDFDGYGECWEEEDGCEATTNPEVVFLWDRDGETFLYRGEVEVTLQETDDDGAASEVTKTVNIANVPPYAAFGWETDEWSSWSELDCDSCEATYGSGDPVKTANNGSVTVTRTIHSWDCGGGGEEASAILAPWGVAEVEIEITGTGTVELTETIPEGWEYGGPWGDECVMITEQGDSSWSATVDLDACEGPVYIDYELYPPEDVVEPGPYTIHGTFDGTTLDSTVILCTTVDVDVEVYLHGFGWDDLWMADPNGDDIMSWEWDFGEFGTASGQDPSGDCCDFGDCYLTLEEITCEYDFERGWFWSYDLPVSLTVTDEAGGATTVETEIHLEGPCEGGAPE